MIANFENELNTELAVFNMEATCTVYPNKDSERLNVKISPINKCDGNSHLELMVGETYDVPISDEHYNNMLGRLKSSAVRMAGRFIFDGKDWVSNKPIKELI